MQLIEGGRGYVNQQLRTEYPRDENGWIQFPRDAARREMYVGKEIASRLNLHPAKMNAFCCEAIIEQNTKPGEIVVDPFGGIGTTLMEGASKGRQVILLELEPEYVELAQITDSYMRQNHWIEPNVVTMIRQGDNRGLLPFPCDHIVTSPPYGADLYKEEGQALDSSIQRSVTTYANSNLNIGRFDGFMYNKQMDLLYKKMVDSIRPGGTITITHRDRSRAGARILYGLEIMRMLSKHGMELFWWDKWKAPGSFQSRVNEKKGAKVILDEDIISFKKPE
jgi:DNA modification methylase